MARMLPLLPLRDIIVYPHMVVPLFVGREKSIAALEEAMAADKELLLAAQRKAKTNDPGEEDIFEVGTIGHIIQLLRLPDGTVKVLVEGKRRARIQRFEHTEPYFFAEIEELEETSSGEDTDALVRTIKEVFETYAKLNKRIPPEMLVSVQTIEEPGRLADTVVAHLSLKLADKQAILELQDPAARLVRLHELMQIQIENLQVEKKIRSRVKKQMEKSQKEYYLNEQMQAIQKELGERDEFKNELQELEQRIKDKVMSAEAKERALKEFKKLKMMSPMSAEATVVRNYIDWILALPWAEKSDDRIELDEAERILDQDHYGLQKPKERVLEYLAVQALVDKIRGPILCLVGPPGVGKTSLARSIARATGRKFVRQSLGGVRDEAEIRGHRRTYIGAMPGKLLQSLKKVGTNNPVFLLDEIDKMSQDFRGDPASALLEVLDPEQNSDFGDHYLDLDYDLSEVLFVTTANTQHQIPLPLQDRLEIINIPGYTEWEKLAICKQYLIPKQMELNGLAVREQVEKDDGDDAAEEAVAESVSAEEASAEASEDTDAKPKRAAQVDLEFTDECIREIIHRYTREAGVRNLEREIGTVCRKVAKDWLKTGKEAGKKYTIGPDSLPDYLGVKKYRKTTKEDSNEIGLANGLAVTSHGGDLLPAEVTIVPGKGKLTLTGKLGDVMQESAKAAMSYIRSRSESLGLVNDFNTMVDIHVHFPEGAIPKDGPSAGITMVSAITSALLRIPVRQDVAMTGEVTLRGRVLPIGGLKEKILAAHRADVFTVIIPKENEKDLKDIPERILDAMTVHAVEDMDEVLKLALAHEDPAEFLVKPSETVDWRESIKRQPPEENVPQHH